MSTPYLTSYTNKFSFARGATRVGDAAQAAEIHRSKALAEIDGLFAGFQYLEKTEGNQNSNARPVNTGSAITDRAAFDEFERDLNDTIPHSNLADNSSLPHNDKENQPTEGQSPRRDWSSIRDVMEGSEHHWYSFQKLAEKLELPAVNKIRNQYENPRGLREAGVFAFRETLCGEAPKDLKGVFAFASLSFVVSKLLYSIGRIEKHKILSGIMVWRDSIQDPDERDVFLKLAEELWPEAKSHLHFIPLNTSQRHLDHLHEISSTENPSWHQQNESLVPPMTHTTQAQQEHRGQEICDVNLETPEFFDYAPEDLNLLDQECFSQLSEAYENPSLPEQVFELTEHTRETWKWHDFSPPWHDVLGSNGVVLTACHVPLLDVRSLDNSPEGRPPDSMNDSLGIAMNAPTCKDLRGTTVFQAVAFYLWNFGSFFYLLSGGGLSAKSLQSINTFNAEKTGLKDYILNQYLESLKNSGITLSSQSLAIWAVARKFVKLGCLQSVDEVQDYLMTVGREILPNGKPFTQFSRWVYSLVQQPDIPLSSPSYPDIPEDRKPRRSKSTAYPCEVCGRTFKNSSNLSRHRKMHKAPQPCPVGCGWNNTSGRADKARAHLSKKHAQ